MDVGYLNDRPFLGTAGIGFDARVAHQFDRSAKRGFGKYFQIIVKEVFGAAPMRVKLQAAGQELEEEVLIEAYDVDGETPIRGAQVVMHPYRTFTDETGTASMRVAGGDYIIMVSGSKYIPVKTEIKVAENITTRAHLMPEPPLPTPDDDYK